MGVKQTVLEDRAQPCSPGSNSKVTFEALEVTFKSRRFLFHDDPLVSFFAVLIVILLFAVSASPLIVCFPAAAYKEGRCNISRALQCSLSASSVFSFCLSLFFFPCTFVNERWPIDLDHNACIPSHKDSVRRGGGGQKEKIYVTRDATLRAFPFRTEPLL